MNRFKFELPIADFEELQEKAAGRQKQGVMVNRKSLGLLLIDHSRALAKLQEMGITLDDEYEYSSQVRQAKQGR